MARGPHLWIPGGTPRALNVTRSRVELPWGVMQRFIEFAELSSTRALGVHCAKCDEDIRGTNGEHDPILELKCGCREFWSVNPRVGKA